MNLLSFFEGYKMLAPDTKDFKIPFHEIVTDKSFANINAITCALNAKTLPQYLDECFEILINTETQTKKLDELVVIRLCSSHTTKTIRDDIRKYYNKEQEIEMCRMIGSMFNITPFFKLCEFIKNVIIITMSPCKTLILCNAVELVKSLSVLDVNVNEEEYEEALNTESETTNDAIYKNSKFYQLFNDYALSISFTRESTKEANLLYSPNIIQRFLKNRLAYIPLWSQVLTNLRSVNEPRANNGPIENYFMQMKREVRQSHCELGHFGHIKCGRFIDFSSKAIDINVKKIAFSVPSRARLNKKKRQSAEETTGSIIFSDERYKKTERKRSLFFGEGSEKKN